jgi:hypothetical protein
MALQEVDCAAGSEEDAQPLKWIMQVTKFTKKTQRTDEF